MHGSFVDFGTFCQFLGRKNFWWNILMRWVHHINGCIHRDFCSLVSSQKRVMVLWGKSWFGPPNQNSNSVSKIYFSNLTRYFRVEKLLCAISKNFSLFFFSSLFIDDLVVTFCLWDRFEWVKISVFLAILSLQFCYFGGY